MNRSSTSPGKSSRRTPPQVVVPKQSREQTLSAFRAVRRTTGQLAAPLSPEDMMVQSMPDASPTKWHLAHTTWFFETFVVARFARGYKPFDERYGFLFNSYYESLGPRQPRARRGALSRPAAEEILRYRAHVDRHVAELITKVDATRAADLLALVTIGIHHEQQHQELILTDIHHALSESPLKPSYGAPLRAPTRTVRPLEWVEVDEGLARIGHGGDGFSFDNETPRHRVFLESFALASRPVTVFDYQEFIADRGYQRPELWLSDGWAKISAEGLTGPLYWQRDGERDREHTLAGLVDLDLSAPVAHVSYYEADAYARWAGARLPTETEWEFAAETLPISGNFLESGILAPRGDGAPRTGGLRQMFGDVWEWTQSPYVAYPRFKPQPGALGEYNGKFMVDQMVLRGGSCFTPESHIRATYRNFFPAGTRWQMSGIRLAKDLS